MLITLKYFGMLVEITNLTQESFALKKDACTLKSIQQNITNKYPKLKEVTYNIAVNQKMATQDQPIKEGDELAFLPPFAGG